MNVIGYNHIFNLLSKANRNNYKGKLNGDNNEENSEEENFYVFVNFYLKGIKKVQLMTTLHGSTEAYDNLTLGKCQSG